MILWEGYCITHQRVTAEDVTKVKEAHPDALVLVHPECRPEVVELADFVGSTKQIIDFATASEGKKFIIGTEMGVLTRLKKDNPDKTFYLLSQGLICPNMKKTKLESVYHALRDMKYAIELEEEIRVKIKDPSKTMRHASIVLEEEVRLKAQRIPRKDAGGYLKYLRKEFLMGGTIDELKKRAIQAKDIGIEDALTLYDLGMKNPFLLMAAAAKIREHFKGNKVNLCGIVNAKSGLCSEDCKFCAQSAHYCTDIPEYPFIGKAGIVEKARQAKTSGAHMFGIITSGTRVDSEDEWNEIYQAISDIKTLGIQPCVSLGMLDNERARKLKEAGLYRYHHNLETARSYFDNICTTHEYQEDIDTVHGRTERRSFHLFRRYHRSR